MPQDFASRLKLGWLRLQATEGKEVDQKEIAKRAGKALKRKPFSQATVSRWFNGTVPDVETVGGLALALKVDPGWLAFGEASAAPAPGETSRSSDSQSADADAADVRRMQELQQVAKAEARRHRRGG